MALRLKVCELKLHMWLQLFGMNTESLRSGEPNNHTINSLGVGFYNSDTSLAVVVFSALTLQIDLLPLESVMHDFVLQERIQEKISPGIVRASIYDEAALTRKGTWIFVYVALRFQDDIALVVRSKAIDESGWNAMQRNLSELSCEESELFRVNKVVDNTAQELTAFIPNDCPARISDILNPAI